MKNLVTFTLAIVLTQLLRAQPGPWLPPVADSSFPRTIINNAEAPAVRAALASGVNIDLYAEVYANATSTPPAANDDIDTKRRRSHIAKNAAFCLYLGVKPSGSTTVMLNSAENTYLKNTARTLLEEINTYVNILSTDSPTNYDLWQWTSKEIVNYTCAYDLLKGWGVTSSELSVGRDSLKSLVGNLYNEATKASLGGSFFQGAKNNHALMTAASLGIAAVAMNDLSDTVEIFKPVNWINAAMWNIHNVMWWDIKRQSHPGKYAGYAEGTYYFKYAFCNMLPFFRSMGNFVKDTMLNYEFLGINRKIRNPWYDSSYKRVYEWIAAIRMPDGRIPPIEDSYTYRCFPELAILRKPEYVWPVALSQLDPVQYNTLSSQLVSVFDMRADYIAANVTPVITPDSLFKPLPDAGIAVFRSSWDSSATYLALTGKNGNALLSADAHNHADDGSFLMMVNGQMMALDPGYLSYEFRDTVCKAWSHNMLLVDDTATLSGIPGKSNGSNCYIEKFFSSPVQHYAELRTSYRGAEVNRKVLFVRNRYFLMVDHLSHSAPQPYSYLLHGYGLEGGDQTNTGIFTDMFANRRAAWTRRNSGLYVTLSSDAPVSFSKETSVHEYIYQAIQNHTMMEAKTSAVPAATFLTCLQPVKTLADTFAVENLSLGSATAYRVQNSGNTDIAISQSTGSMMNVPKGTTGLTHDYTTDAKFLWTSENAGNVNDLFVQKARVLLEDNDTIFSADGPVNVQYLRTGSKTFTGFVGDTGWIRFHTGEYPAGFYGQGIWYTNYDAQRRVMWAYFSGPTRIDIVLNDLKLGLDEGVGKFNRLSVYPNPATDRLTVDLEDLAQAGSTLELIDLAGRTVLQQKLETDSRHADLDVADLGNGVYIARLTDVSGRYSAPVKVLISR